MKRLWRLLFVYFCNLLTSSICPSWCTPLKVPRLVLGPQSTLACESSIAGVYVDSFRRWEDLALHTWRNWWVWGCWICTQASNHYTTVSHQTSIPCCVILQAGVFFMVNVSYPGLKDTNTVGYSKCVLQWFHSLMDVYLVLKVVSFPMRGPGWPCLITL